jgi:UDP-galactopyranose mutase
MPWQSSRSRGLSTREVEAVNLEQRALQIVGKDIFNMFIKGYTEKQWGRPASELPPQIIERSHEIHLR